MNNKTYTVTKPLKNQLPHCDNQWLDSVNMYLYHTTGGVNYYNNKTYPNGWYISFSPVHINKYDTYQTKSTIMFHKRSFKMLCNDAGRFSEKRFEKLKEELIKRKEKIVELYDNRKDQELFAYIQQNFMGIK